MDKTVFLTGGAGRIGIRVLKLLLKRGYKVKALVHRHRPEGFSDANVEFVRGDILNQEQMKEAVKGTQIICHLAASFDMFPPIIFEKENNTQFDNLIRGTYNLLEAAHGLQDLDIFLFTSTDAVYATGPLRYDTPITEDSELFPCPGRFYALAKAVGESLCINYGKTFGLPWIIIRINWALTSDELLKIFEYEFWEDDIDSGVKKLLGPKLANGKGVFAPLDRNGESVVDQIADPDDTAEGIALAIDKCNTAKNNIFNIAAPASFRYLDVIERVASGLGVSWESGKVSGFEPYEISNEKAKRMLGYNPRYTMEQMIDKALRVRKYGK
jgi:nucleoside-diphosphate-sugar epimerase